nr:methyltransferase [Nostoc flagelliforme]
MPASTRFCRPLVVSGNFFESVTAGGDAYLLKHIIHDWDEEKAIAILKNCHQAMSQHGTLPIRFG